MATYADPSDYNTLPDDPSFHRPVGRPRGSGHGKISHSIRFKPLVVLQLRYIAQHSNRTFQSTVEQAVEEYIKRSREEIKGIPIKIPKGRVEFTKPR